MKKLILLTLIFFNAFNNSYSQNDSLALVAFYNATNGANWINHNGWLELGQPVSQWYGVTVENNRVVSLQLYSNSLTGNLPPEIGQLTSLVVFDLSNNQLTGSVPPEIGSVNGLYDLRLERNELSGEIPQEICNLTNLQYVDFSNNYFDNQSCSTVYCLMNRNVNFYDFPQIQKTGFSLTECNYSPFAMDSLALVALYNATNGPGWWNNTNWLNGPISTWHGVYFEMDYNSGYQRVRGIQLSNNNLNGIIPGSIVNLSYLFELNLSNNQLQDTIPRMIFQMPELRLLDLSFNMVNNNFWFPPDPFMSPSNLEVINLQGNFLGDIPWLIEMIDFPTLRELNLSGCGIWGELLINYWRMPELYYLNLSGNQITKFCNEWECNNFPWIISNLRWLDLSMNQINDSIILKNICNLTNLEWLDLTGNQLIGSIPHEIGQLKNLWELNLSNQQLSGPVPPEIGQLQNLYSLNLNYNQFTEIIPEEIFNMANLSQLFLSGNLIDSLPDIGTTANLNYFSITDNKLTFEDLENNMDLKQSMTFDYNYQKPFGEYKSILLKKGDSYNLEAICGGSQNMYQWFFGNTPLNEPTSQSNFLLEDLDFSDVGTYSCKVTNELVPGLTLHSEQINIQLVEPPCNVSDSLVLVALYNSTNGNNWSNKTNWLSSKRVIYWYGITTFAGRVTRISLDYNNLGGQITPLLGNLAELRYLSLYSNKLTGTIPLEIYSLTYLKDFNLSNNQFSGSIPGELCNLTSLRYLDLSRNQLSGSIPSGITQMPNLSSFYANDNLFDSLPDFLKSNHYLSLNVSRNKLSFEDLEYNLDLSSTPYLSYSPQDSIGESKIIIAKTGENLMYKLTTGGEFNQYQWYKDGQKLTGQTSAILTLNNLSLSNSGKYRCAVSNTKVTRLTLFSRVITIKVENPLRIACTDYFDFDVNKLPDYQLHVGITATGGCSTDESIVIQLVDEIYSGLDENSGICPTKLERIYIANDQCGNVSEPCTQTYTFNNDGNCEVCIDNPDTTEDDVPYFTVILDKPDTTWISPPVVRNGICCFAQGTSTPECVSFNVYLHEDAVGLVFDISSGAISGGAFYYKVDCGPLQKLGDFVCLQGGRFYTLTFCEPGNNPNTYSIQTVAGAITTKELNTRADTACIGQVHVSGLIPSSINWSVKYPSGASDLIKYLDISSDTANPIFRPDEHTPALIVYEACGALIGEPKCNNVPLTDCAEIIINTLPPVRVSLNVNVTALCEDSIPSITALIFNQDTNLTYTYNWYNAFEGNLGTGSVVSTNNTYKPPTHGNYSVEVAEISSGIGCNTDIYNFTVSVDLAGPMLFVPPSSLYLDCNNPNPELTIQQWLATAYAVDDDGSGLPVYWDYNLIDLSCGVSDTINFWAVDNCGNQTRKTQIIDVVDQIAPTISPVASNGTSDCSTVDPGSDPSFLAWIANNGGAVATDGCDPNLTWTHDLASQVWTGDPANNQITITFTVTDDCGNTANTTASYSIVDNVPPTIICEMDITDTATPDNCSKILLNDADPIISDNCIPIGSLMLTFDLSGATTGSGIGTVTDVNFNVGVTTVTYTVWDLAGNTASCSFTVTIVDVTPPTIALEGCTDVEDTISADNCSKIPVTLINPTYTDDCSPVSNLILTWTMSGATTGSGTGSVVGETFNIGVTTVSYTVIDPYGNTASCSFNVTILDFTIPSFTVECQENIGPVPAEIGVCGANVSISVPLIFNPCNEEYTIINDSPYRTNDSDASGTYPVGTTTFTWSIVDASGNFTNCEQTIIVTDDQIPLLNCPQNVYINSDENIPNPFDSPDAFIQAGGSITDNCMIDWASFGVIYESIDTFYTHFVLKRNYTVIDYNGNTDICVHELSIENDSSCVRHFHPVWEGTFGFDHMNVNVTGAQLDGLDLEPGDEIGVFDGYICVGYGKVTQTIDHQNVLNIVVSRDDGSGNGYSVGNDISYIIWDCSSSEEHPVQNIQCFNIQQIPVQCTTFTPGATTFVLLSGYTLETQQISLYTGWNIMSIRVMPENENLIEILQPLIAEDKLKKVMDESGNTIEDWGVYGGWKNKIGEIKNTEGYKINITSPATLKIEGVPIQFPYNILLNTGWNIISWPASNEQDGMTVFHSLIDAGKLQKVMDETGKTIENWGVFGGWKNYIGNFKPGEGYTVNVTGECVLTVNESGTKSEVIIPELIASTHFIPVYQGYGTDHMNINLVNLAESGIIGGDEIGIFDGNICVGSARISNLTPIAIGALIANCNSISIPVSAIDGIEGKNGYYEGNSISLKLFRNGFEYPMTIEPLNNSKTVFEKGKSLFATVGLTTGLEEGIADTNQPEIKCYPNPFSDKVTIEIKLVTDSKVEVEVLNQLGQSVKIISTKQRLAEGLHKLIWDGKNIGNKEIAPGIYHLKVNIGEITVFRNIVYTK